MCTYTSKISPRHLIPSASDILQQPVSHGLKFINTLFGVALTNLAQGLVFVTARLHILGVDQVIGGPFTLIDSFSQLGAQELKENTDSE